MNATLRLVAVLVACLACHAAAESPSAQAIKAGEQARADKDYDAALAAFVRAEEVAGSATDVGIARGKRAYIHAYDLKDYDAAMVEAAAALELEDTHPVARVTAMRVNAQSLMKAEEDYESAMIVLEEARDLEDVEFAQPTIGLSLGDCYRFTKRYGDAIAAYESVLSMPNANDGIRAVAHLNVGMTYQYNLREPHNAEPAYAAALELNPGLEKAVATHRKNMR